MLTTNKTGKAKDAEKLLALLHISSSALPIGAFAYSQGLEYALESGWCKNRQEVQAWITDSLNFGLGQLDLPIYLRIYHAWTQVLKTQNAQSLNYWNETLLAFRETKELYLEDVQVGNAYAQWHLGQDPERQQYLDQCQKPSVVAMSSLAAVLNGIGITEALLGFVWGWAENQITCANKSMPMGQTDGQRILQALRPKMVDACDLAQHFSDHEIGSGLFGSAMASALHEQQYSRLFRS